jgi:hypothetical protein
MVDNVLQTDVVSLEEINNQGVNCDSYTELYYKAIFNFATKMTHAHPLDSIKLRKLRPLYIYFLFSDVFSESNVVVVVQTPLPVHFRIR